jgi:hypothetical protein
MVLLQLASMTYKIEASLELVLLLLHAEVWCRLPD